MRIIVSDSSCLIDLRKASLLEVFLKVPYEILIPNTLFEDELLKFTEQQKKMLVKGGLKVMDLPGDRVLRAQEVTRSAPRLSIHDAFAFVLAESYPGCVMLTGDGPLRELAMKHKMEVHGVLWVVDEIHKNGLAKRIELLAVLRSFSGDRTVRLPAKTLTAYIKRYEGGE
jgi:predicted nucleic acid-binding protein